MDTTPHPATPDGETLAGGDAAGDEAASAGTEAPEVVGTTRPRTFDWPIAVRRCVAIGIGAGVVLLDLLTKLWAEASLPGRVIEVIPGLLEFDLTFNPGSAFSLFQDAGPFLAVAAVVAAIVIWFSLSSSTSPLEVVGLGLILGGAVGNLIDRVRRAEGFLDGAVVDFIELPNWPTFNVADSAITIGVVVLLWGALRPPR